MSQFKCLCNLTMEELSQLHARHLSTLSGEEQLDYLLECQSYLAEEDVTGWKKSFAPELLIEKKEQGRQKKRRRMSPDAYIWTPYPPCESCGSKDIISDTQAGSVVCTACGLIQVLQQIGTGTASMSYEQLKNGSRKTVHRYSRVVYFRSFLLGLQGKTAPVITKEEEKSMQVTCAGSSWIDEHVINAALKKLKLATKFRRHRYTLAARFNPQYKPVRIPAQTFMELLRLFRIVECHWQHGLKRKLGKRRVFFSYPYVYYQLCYHMDVMQYTGVHHLLHDNTLLDKLHYAYSCVAKKGKLKFNSTVYRT